MRAYYETGPIDPDSETAKAIRAIEGTDKDCPDHSTRKIEDKHDWTYKDALDAALTRKN